MKWKIIAHFNKETGKLKGYSLAYKPFPFIPYWVECNDALYSIEMAEHTIIWQLSMSGQIKHKDVFE
jgi:hypothetical protein